MCVLIPEVSFTLSISCNGVAAAALLQGQMDA
jgi:hypothetical protein